MSDRDRQFREADAAIKSTVGTLINSIKQMMGRWESVAPTYIVQSVLLGLSEELPKLIDDPVLADRILGSEELKLSTALADYRESHREKRGA
jgi:hypothetical protein